MILTSKGLLTVRNGLRAVELLPVERDAQDGPVPAANLVAIHAGIGEHDSALEQWIALRNLPNGSTSGTLRMEPEWDVLRSDSRFQKLLG